MMILSKEEKKIVLIHRIEQEQARTLLGAYDSYQTGENKVRRLQKRVEQLNINSFSKSCLEVLTWLAGMAIVSVIILWIGEIFM